MTGVALISLLAAIPAGVLLFLVLPNRYAVLVNYLLAWLFLPQVEFDLPGFLPTIDRHNAPALASLLGLAFVSPERLLVGRPRWPDAFMALWCLAPLFSSISNGLGVYDGVSGVLTHTLSWGLTYYIARQVLADWEGLTALAHTIVIGGLIYLPLCALEARLSPQLHRWVYGFHAHDFLQTVRLGGWRPTVFLQHGLAVGLWMACATLLAFQLAVRRAHHRAPLLLLLACALFGCTLLCRSLGAILLLGLGGAVLCFAGWSRSRWPLIALCLLPLLYVGVRASGLWRGQELVQAANAIRPARAQSVQYRIHNEEALLGKALERPLLGWGGWGRNLIRDERGQSRTVTDGWWILAFGKFGVLGLVAFYGLILSGPLALWTRQGSSLQAGEQAAAHGLALVLCLFALDTLLNAMFNPFFVLSAGGLLSVALAPRRAPAPAAAPRRAPFGTPPLTQPFGSLS